MSSKGARLIGDLRAAMSPPCGVDSLDAEGHVSRGVPARSADDRRSRPPGAVQAIRARGVGSRGIAAPSAANAQ
jgi:hypothetical protein